MNNELEQLEQAELERLLFASIDPQALSDRQQHQLAARLTQSAANSIAGHAGLVTIRRKEGAWRPLRGGIQLKFLWAGTAGNSVLVRLAPGSSLPVHRHKWAEEGIVLEGGLQMGTLEMERFDYHFSPPQSHHDRISSRQGCLAFLRGTSLGHLPSVLQELGGALLPRQSLPSKTIFARDDHWETASGGVFKKELWSDGRLASRLFRFEAGARLAGHPHPEAEECMMLSGEIFLGDILLQAGDYQAAPAGTQHFEAYSDTGALLFVHGAAA